MAESVSHKSKWGDCPVCWKLLNLEDKYDIYPDGTIKPHWNKLKDCRCDGTDRKPDTHRYE